MWEPTPPLTVICFGSTLGVYALVWLACRELYRYWDRNIRRQPLSGVYQVVRLFGWLLGGAVIISSGIWILWAFSAAFVVYVAALLS